MDPECFVAPGFEKVKDVFKENLKSGIEKGGSFAVYYKGELVVNIWGGLADVEKKRPWSKDVLSVFWSSTKGVTAIVVGHLVDRGLLSYKDKISKHWPEFAQKGKGNASVEDLMLNKTGLVQLDGEWELKEFADDYPKFEKRMAEQEPYWKIGAEEFGYHSLTFALYIDALVRRVDPKKRTLSQYFNEEFAKPLELDFDIGLPTDKFDKSPTLYPYGDTFDMEEFFKELMNTANPKYIERSIAHKSPKDLEDYFGSINTPEFRRIPCGSSNGCGTAESLAKLYGILANGGKYDGKQILSKESIEGLEAVKMTGVDQMIGVKVQRGLGTYLIPVLVNDNFDKPVNLFGHPGAGGQFAYGDRSAKLGVAYTSNFLKLGLDEFNKPDPRFGSCLDATYSCLSMLEGEGTKRQIFANYGTFEKAKESAKK